MYNSLLNKINAGETLTNEDIEMVNSLSESERNNIMSAYSKKKQELFDEKLRQYFIQAYEDILKVNSELEVKLKHGYECLSEENFHKSYRNHLDQSLNEIMVAVIQRDDFPQAIHDEVLDRLFEKNIGLIGAMLRKYSNKNDGKMTMEDLGQEARLSLLKAIKKFDVSRGYKFSTFAMTVIHHCIIGQYQTKVNRMRREEISTETVITDDGGSQKTLLDYQVDPNPTPEEAFMTDVRNNVIYEILNELKPDQKFVAYCRFGLGGVPKKTQAEIAKYMNMSQANVSKIESNMLKALKKGLEREGIF